MYVCMYVYVCNNGKFDVMSRKATYSDIIMRYVFGDARDIVVFVEGLLDLTWLRRLSEKPGYVPYSSTRLRFAIVFKILHFSHVFTLL